jgi:predicted RNase H-like HicB family nuclease
MAKRIEISLDREKDGRWIADVPALPGVMTYGNAREEALRNVKALALRIIADRLENGEKVPEAITQMFESAR